MFAFPHLARHVRSGSFASILACPPHVRLRGNLGKRRWSGYRDLYDKLAANYLAIVKLASISILIA
jgi:hypothetical protein